MNTKKPFLFLTSMALLSTPLLGKAAQDSAPTAQLTPIAKGAMDKVGYYMPQKLSLTSAKPASITKEPKYTGTEPMYGLLNFGTTDKAQVAIAVDEAKDDSSMTLYVDSNGDGDLTNDTPIIMKRQAQEVTNPQNNQKLTFIVFAGNASVGSGDAGQDLGIYRFGRETAKQRGVPADALLYYRNYAREGKLELSGKTYNVLLLDERTTGRYDSWKHGEQEPAALTLFVDRNNNGKFEQKFEAYDLSKPFNIGGTTYEVDKVAADGSQLTLKTSAEKVAEVSIPADLSAGHSAVAFKMPVIGGKLVSFPQDYKGKVVMLDFWATWCGPCRGEIPGLVKAYQKYHSKGFEVLGVTLDQKDQLAAVKQFMTASKMTWPQVYDGKFWQAEVAQKYGIDSIPHAYLVDGTTGKIIAEGDSLRGDALDGTVAKALANVSGKKTALK